MFISCEVYRRKHNAEHDSLEYATAITFTVALIYTLVFLVIFGLSGEHCLNDCQSLDDLNLSWIAVTHYNEDDNNFHRYDVTWDIFFPRLELRELNRDELMEIQEKT
jgi:hypothetical protein